MKIILVGTPAFATDVFAHLYSICDVEILGLITQPDRPFGRKAEIKATHTKAYFTKTFPHLPIWQPESMNALNALIPKIKSIKPDMILVVAYGRILPKAFLQIAPCINLHGSILPQYRGASPIQQMILSQPHFFGISAILLDEFLDSGDILGFSFVKNNKQDFNALSLALAKRGAELLCKVMHHIEDIKPLKQIEANASYCGKIHKSQGLVAFKNAKDVFRAYLAYCAYPNIHIKSSQGYILKLFDVKLIESSVPHETGEILQINSQSVLIGCDIGSIEIGAIQQEGKTRMQAPLYLNGKRLKKGDILC